MEMADVFNAEIKVPNITDLSAVEKVVQEIKLFNDGEHRKAFEMLSQCNLEGKLTLGIKKLLMISEMARQDVDKVEKFVGTVQDECISRVITATNGIR